MRTGRTPKVGSPRRRGPWVAMVMIFLGLLSAPAYAHPVPQSYSPADGSSMASPPSEAAVEFDEVISDGNLVVYDPCGARVDSGSTQVVATRISVGVSADKAGVYTGVWTVIGRDGHKVSGDWNFTVTDAEPCPGSEPEEDPEEPKGKGGGNGSTEDSEGSDAAGSGSSGSVEAADDTTAPGDKGDQRKRSRGKDRKKHHGHRDASSEDTTDRDTGGVVVPTDPAAPSNDIPLNWLLISFAVAGAIGAAAGQIYVDLLPERKDVAENRT